MRRPSVILFAALLAASTPAAAETIHHCTGENGESAFSDRPCGAPVATGVAVPRVRPPSGGLRPGELALLAEPRETKRHTARRSRAAGKSTQERQAYRCREKRRSLEAVSAELRRGYKPGRGEKLRRRRRAYEDYLSTFCR
ncbi:MAG: DUF4124 domain-containing protein [Gammaproteobacteria bacterium]|nr:DUF4124 domain-containing protein [Gammaproteobacteria bacterium]